MNIDHVVAAYAFTDADKEQLVNILAKSYLLAKTQAYNRAVSRTKQVVTIRNLWQPGESDAKNAQQWASKQVDSIAETYETLLQHAIEQMAEEPYEALGDVIGKVKGIVGAIGDWFKGFLPWKTQQIADQTWSEGDNDGTEQFVDDVKDDENVDEVVSGGKSMLRVVILPANSSSDECAEIAGKTFVLDEAPNPPMHINCIHYQEIVLIDE